MKDRYKLLNPAYAVIRAEELGFDAAESETSQLGQSQRLLGTFFASVKITGKWSSVHNRPIGQ
jgi:hypothetical protein